MKTIVSLLAILCLLFIFLAITVFADNIDIKIDPTSRFYKLQLATIQIGVGSKGGAGVIIKEDKDFLYIATVKHAVTIKGKLKVVIRRKDLKLETVKNISRKNVYTDKILDLAIVKVPKPKGEFEILNSAIKSPPVGETIYTIGHPLSVHNTINIGIVSNYIRNPFPKKRGVYMLVSAPSFAGNSGGAVVNENMELVGITSGIMWLGDNPRDTKHVTFLYHMTYSIRIEEIKALLETL